MDEVSFERGGTEVHMWKKLGREQRTSVPCAHALWADGRYRTAEVAVGPPRRPAASEFAVLVSTSGIWKQRIAHTKEKAGILCSGLVYLRLVAGDRNVLKIPTIPFSFDILRPAAWFAFRLPKVRTWGFDSPRPLHNSRWSNERDGEPGESYTCHLNGGPSNCMPTK